MKATAHELSGIARLAIAATKPRIGKMSLARAVRRNLAIMAASIAAAFRHDHPNGALNVRERAIRRKKARRGLPRSWLRRGGRCRPGETAPPRLRRRRRKHGTE